MGRLILGIIIFSSLAFAGQIFKYNGNNIVGCYKQSDAFLGFVVSVTSPSEFKKSYQDTNKCMIINSTTGLELKVLKKVDVPTAKGSVTHFYLKALTIRGKPIGELKLWFADILKSIQKEL